MTQKTPDFLSKILQQLGQTWKELAPTLQLQLVKLLKAVIPILEKLQTNLVVSTDTSATTTGSTDSAESQTEPVVVPSSSQATSSWKLQAAKVVQIVTESLDKLKQKLETDVTVANSALRSGISNEEAIAIAKAETSDPLLTTTSPSGSDRIAGVDPEQVKAELNTAWSFVKQKLVPKILFGLNWVAEKIDPPLTTAWQKISQQAQATPSLVNTWVKVKSSRTWQQASTATAPLWRSLGEKLEPIANSENVKPLLEKRVAVSTMAAVLVLFILLKPSPASHSVAKVPISKTFGQPADILIVPAERGDAPISPEQIMITDIQAQVADVSKKYGEALIQSVQTNFRLGRLIVQLTNEWFQLSPVKQDQLMAELFERSQALNFKKLLIADADKHLLARSPAIGGEMVVLKR